MKRGSNHGSTEHYLAKYRAWCRFFPAEFKKRFGGELEQVFQTSLEEAEEKYGEKGMQAEYRAAIADIVPAILHEQLTSLPTVQRMFSGGNLLWRLYVLLYWPLVGLGVLGLTSAIFTPVAATLLLALYLLAHLAIWFATTTVRTSLIIVVCSIVLFYLWQASVLAMYFGQSPVSDLVWNVLGILVIGTIAAVPYAVSLFAHVRKERATHQKVRLLSTEELIADDRRQQLKRFRRNTGALCVVFSVLLLNLAYQANDSGKAERVWQSQLLTPRFTEELQDLKRSDNLYYSLMLIDGPAVSAKSPSPGYVLFREVVESQQLGEANRLALEELTAPLAADFATFSEAADKPYFLHPGFRGQTEWAIQAATQIEHLPGGVSNFRRLALLHAVAEDAKGNHAAAQQILTDSVAIGKLVAAEAPNEGWYLNGLQFIGDVQRILPLLREETRAAVARSLPTIDEVMAMRKGYLENYALTAMSFLEQFEQQNGFASLTLLYLPNQTRLDLERALTLMGERTIVCEDVVALEESREAGYQSYDSWGRFQEYVVPQVSTYVSVNGQGKGLLQSLFMYPTRDWYFHYTFAVPECMALGYQITLY